MLAFPGVFRGALDAGARRITEAMKLAAADAIFSVVADDLAPAPHRAEPVRPPGGARGGRGGRGGSHRRTLTGAGAVRAGASDRNGTLGVSRPDAAGGYGPWAMPAMRCRPIGRIGRIVAAGRSLDE